MVSEFYISIQNKELPSNEPTFETKVIQARTQEDLQDWASFKKFVSFSKILQSIQKYTNKKEAKAPLESRYSHLPEMRYWLQACSHFKEISV